MNLLAVGMSFRSADVALRERLAFTDEQRDTALRELAARYGCEAAVLSTCNRVELYLGKPGGDEVPDLTLVSEFLAEIHRVDPLTIRSHLVPHPNADGVRHLFRVAASLDSLIVGEGQIVGQVKAAFEAARSIGSAGPLLNALYQHAQRTAKRVRTETGISAGHVSVSSVAVDYVREVFDHFGDKTVLVIGAGKMGRLTLKHLRELRPKQILVTNRSPDKATELANECGGQAFAWDRLDDGLAQADIVLSTTGAAEPVVTAKRYAAIRPRRAGRTAVILDIAVPRDFEPAIHDGESTFLFNIDDLRGVREQTLNRRRSHVDRAEAIVEDEARRFVEDWGRRKNGQLIARLTAEFEARRREVVEPLLGRLNGKLTAKERQDVEAAFRLYQNKLLHGPISALGDASKDGGGPALLDAIRRLFRLD
ncbi:MAG TPA: glutamyl-tRNA reductase [Gemmataceae bacterium]|jgi:glutamyl-tRNA reductase|nr:glutamyl-tRNA reductase [Gemmataceae bacterium]